MLTQTRADILSEILNAEAGRAKILLTIDPYDALALINTLGHDFTLDEINEYAEHAAAEHAATAASAAALM